MIESDPKNPKIDFTVLETVLGFVDVTLRFPTFVL
jgi:hypothetical protein